MHARARSHTCIVCCTPMPLCASLTQSLDDIDIRLDEWQIDMTFTHSGAPGGFLQEVFGDHHNIVLRLGAALSSAAHFNVSLTGDDNVTIAAFESRLHMGGGPVASVTVEALLDPMGDGIDAANVSATASLSLEPPPNATTTFALIDPHQTHGRRAGGVLSGVLTPHAWPGSWPGVLVEHEPLSGSVWVTLADGSWPFPIASRAVALASLADAVPSLLEFSEDLARDGEPPLSVRLRYEPGSATQSPLGFSMLIGWESTDGAVTVNATVNASIGDQEIQVRG